MVSEIYERPSRVEVLETSLKSQNLRCGIEATGIFSRNPNRVKREAYTPYAEAVTNSSERVPTQHQPPEPTTDQSTNKSLQTNRSVSLLPTLPVNCVDSMSQIVLSVDKIHGSNILNIKKTSMLPVHHKR